MRSKDRARRLLLFVSMIGLACAGWSRKYQDLNMDFGSVKTVAVLPFANFSRDSVAADRVRDVFSNMLLATSAVYVVPTGDVARALAKVNVQNATAPSAEDLVKLAAALKVDAVLTGTVKEYGEVRSGSAAANVVSMSAQMVEGSSGKVVWSASTTKGGIGFMARLLGSGGSPINDVTEAAVGDLLDKLFK